MTINWNHYVLIRKVQKLFSRSKKQIERPENTFLSFHGFSREVCAQSRYMGELRCASK